MPVAKWGNGPSSACRRPSSRPRSSKGGDDIEIGVIDAREFAVARKPGRNELLKRLRAFRGRLPADLKFGQDEANARQLLRHQCVLIYVASDDPARADLAEKLRWEGGAMRVKGLNEIANIAHRKMRMSWQKIGSFLFMLRGLLRVHPRAAKTHENGLTLVEHHNLPVYDAIDRCFGVARRLRTHFGRKTFKTVW